METGEDPGGTPKPAEAPDGEGPGGREGIYVPDRDNTLKVLPAPEAKSLRSRENEAAQQFKYVEDLCAELELAVLVGNVCEVKCQRRALTSGLRQAEEAIVRTAEAHRWTKAELDRALEVMPCLTRNKPMSFFTLKNRRRGASGYMSARR
jgi:hypothetical protein